MSGPPPHRRPVPGSAGPPRPPRRQPAVRRRPERRAFWVALGISALLHLLFLVVARSITFPGGAPEGTAPREGPAPEASLRVYQLIVPTEEAPAPVTEPDDPEEPAPPAPAQPPVAAAEPAPEPPRTEPGRGPTAAQLLQPRAVDPRLWVRGQRWPELERTEEEVLLERVFATLRALSDSSLAADEAARRALDWTLTDSQGRRWGVSPEGIHLGDVTLPIPVLAQVPPGRRDELRTMERNWAEIQIQAELGAIRATLEERNAAIRERHERARRAEPVADDNNGGSPP